MSDYSMADISSLLQSVGRDSGIVAKNSTSRTNNTDLDMTDFLQLMVVQLQSQTMDDTMDTSEMMNQLVQMQMISAITNMTETNIMTYASSLVGKEVTIGIVENNTLTERVITVTGTGMSDGKQVIFGDDGETYNLSQIMAVGRLPEIEGVNKPDQGGSGDTVQPGEDAGSSGGTGTATDPGVTNPDNPNPGDVANPDGNDDVENSGAVQNPDQGEGGNEIPTDENGEPRVESPELDPGLTE